MKLIICQGVPASGKTTWAKEFISEKQKEEDFSYIRVNRDDFRNSTGVNYHFKNESYITELETFAIITALKSGKNVISDNTNLNEKFLNILIEKASFVGAQIEFKKFDITFAEACKRDALRDAPVGKKVIKSFFHKYFPDFRKKVDTRNYVAYNPILPDCIISDIDGTISLMNGRDPFIGEDCASDLPNTPVISILEDTYRLNEVKMLGKNGLDAVKIILFSGRNGSSQPQTEKWLEDNCVPYDEIYMREEGNYEKDNDLKTRFYNDHIKGNYNVRFVLDDRDQVVKVWRELGLPCFQVHYGDF